MNEELVAVIPHDEFAGLAEIPQPPKQLFRRGQAPISNEHLVCIVGSRRYTSYGHMVCEQLIAGLAGYPITIVSGLALGIDGIAHTQAIKYGLRTIAFPGSSLDWESLYPASHKTLAEQIIEHGGALYSEHLGPTKTAPWLFPMRNRLMAGISEIVVVIEAEEKSGTLITARLATEYNKIVGAVPGAITTPASHGANWLLKMGAVPITSAEDIVRELNIPLNEQPEKDIDVLLNEAEQAILTILDIPRTRDYITETITLDPIAISITLSTLEIKGFVRERYGLIERMR